MASTTTPAQVQPLETRLPCPVCVGLPMEKVALGRPGKILTLDHCTRCGGIWFEKGETQRLTLHSPAELWKLVPPRAHVIRPPCHGCGTPLARESESCAVCSRANHLSCPSCDHRAKREWIDGIMVDVCERCKGAWFDHVELRHVWKLKFTEIARRSATQDGGALLVDSFLWAPDLMAHTLYAGVSGIGDAASGIGSVAASGGVEAASGALGFVGEAAESVFETIAEIVGGIFS